MSSQIKTLGRHTIVYGAGIVVGKLASFIMLPVYTRYLSPADYGVLELLAMTIDVIGMIAGIGVATSVFKFYSDEDDAEGKAQVISTASISATTLAGVTALAGFFLAPLLTRTFIGAETDPLYLRLFFLIYLFQSSGLIPLLLLRARQKSVLFVTVNVARLVMSLSLNILFVVHMRMGVLGVLLGGVITDTVLALGLNAYLIRQVGVRFSTSRFRAMVGFGSPMVLWMLGSFIVVFSDRFFLNHYVGTAEVGIYSLAYKFAFVLSALVFSPFELIWDPHRYEVAKRPDAKEVYAKVFVYMSLVLAVGSLGISLFVEDFVSLMADRAFLPAYRIVPLLLLAQMFHHWVSYCGLGLLVTSNTRTLGKIAVAVTGVTLLLNLLLIPRFGILGATWATIIAYGVRFLMTYRSAQRVYPIPFGWGAIARLFGIFGTAVALRWVLRPDELVPSLAWSTVLLVVAVALAYRYVLGSAERAFVRGYIARSRVGLSLGMSSA